MNKLKVVFDYDGPLHDLLNAIEMATGIKKEKFTRYNFNHCDLTDGERKTVIYICSNPDLFRLGGMRNMEPVTELFLTGLIDVYIHSLNWSPEVAIVKRELIHRNLPWLPDENIILDVGTEKSVLTDVDILIEDSAANIDKSKAKVMNLFFPQYCVKQRVSNPLTTEVSSLEEACGWIIDYLNKRC